MVSILPLGDPPSLPTLILVDRYDAEVVRVHRAHEEYTIRWLEGPMATRTERKFETELMG